MVHACRHGAFGCVGIDGHVADLGVLRSLQATVGPSPAAHSRQTVKLYAQLLPTAGESQPVHGIAARCTVLALTDLVLHLQAFGSGTHALGNAHCKSR